MKIQQVLYNARKKSIDIIANKKSYTLPYSRLRLKPKLADPIEAIYIDPELAREGVTYRLKSGKEDSVPISAFLDYNRDPDYLRNLALHQFSIIAIKAVKHCQLSKHELCRRLCTSPSQLYRLLDPTNTKKSVDEMLRLLSVLGCEIDWDIRILAA